MGEERLPMGDTWKEWEGWLWEKMPEVWEGKKKRELDWEWERNRKWGKWIRGNPWVCFDICLAG